MNVAGSGIATVREKLRDFDRVATALGIPRRERLSILNTTESCYAALQGGTPVVNGAISEELERRLSYAMPLMRRLASNTVGLPEARPDAQVTEQPRFVAA